MKACRRPSATQRAIGAAGLGYVLLAGVENMELLRAPVFGAPAAEIRAAYADGALAAVTIGAGALSLVCFAVFAAGLAARDRAAFAGRSRASCSPPPRCSPARCSPRPPAI